MIYRILIESRPLNPPFFALVWDDIEWLNECGVPDPIPGRLVDILDQRFPHPRKLLVAMQGAIRDMVSSEQWSLVERPLVERAASRAFAEDAVGKLMGPYSAGLLVGQLNVRMPKGFEHKRARFYFTEVGWMKAGRHMAAEAKRQGHQIKIIRRKRPDASQIVYEDEDQLAIVPRKESDRRRHGRSHLRAPVDH